ncbi:MAG: FAD-binding oxidoreductase, partial [Anaerolineae bacterium]|nr:FAD-binding oxidoreductase [Anaerolineae bacterium]
MQTSKHIQELLFTLKKRLRGEVRFDALTRQLYSTDASCYRVVPAGVVIPRDVDDVAAAIELAHRYQVSVVPRGAGTSVSGQAIGPGLIIDHSRHVDRLLEINPAERWAKAEAGMVLGSLNTALRPYQLMVGPDPGSTPMATLGGVAGNNSTGMHSVKYGMLVDHIREVDVILADGSQVNFGPRSPAQVAALAQQT